MSPLAEQTVDTAFRVLPLAALQESHTNPRRRFTELAELAASIRQVGILEPLLVRRVNGHHEIVAGARRYRAASLAGLTEVPCIIRDLDDRAALECAIVENLQRSDVHPLDEADGYAALMKADGAYNVEAIAARVGKSVSYVRNRLKLGTLVPQVREFLDDDRITAAHALVLARLDPALQPTALENCFHGLFRGGDKEEVLAPVRELEAWIEYHVAVDLAAPDTELFPELAEKVAELTAAGAALVPITREWYVNDKKLKPPPITFEHWREVKGKKAACDHTQTGVIVLGDGRGQMLPICAVKTCAKHWPDQQQKSRADGAAEKRELTDYEKKAQKERKLALQFGKVKAEALTLLLNQFEGCTLTPELVQWTVEKVAPQHVLGTVGMAVIGPKKTWTIQRAAALLLWCQACSGVYTGGQLAAALKKHGIDVEKLAATKSGGKARRAKKAR